MPNRILKESICTSETLDNLSPEEERFFYRLLVQCDDFGRLDARPQILRAKCFPLKTDSLTNDDIQRWLKALAEVQLITLYEVEGRPYLQLVTWAKHQQTRAKKSKYPPMSEGEIINLTPDNTCKQMIADDCTCKQMSPYSYSESESNSYSESNSVAVTESETEAVTENVQQVQADDNEQQPLPPPPPPKEKPGKLITLFEKEFGRPLSPLEYEEIRNLHNRHGPELTTEALRRAVAAGKLNLRYINGILGSWYKQNLKTIREVQEYERQREEAKTGGTNRAKPAGGTRAPPGKRTLEHYRESFKDW